MQRRGEDEFKPYTALAGRTSQDSPRKASNSPHCQYTLWVRYEGEMNGSSGGLRMIEVMHGVR